MRHIVFLDIDGVLNSAKNYHAWCTAREAAPETVISLMPHGEDPHVHKLFDGENVRHLNAITGAVDAKIVISSSWRFWFSNRPSGEAELRRILSEVGVAAEVLGFTPPANRDRAGAIAEWLYGRRNVRIAILDDEPPSRFGRLRSWLVRTDGATGLAGHDVKRALRVLSRPLSLRKK